jgi:Ca2+-binding RTX toxin-like protein
MLAIVTLFSQDGSSISQMQPLDIRDWAYGVANQTGASLFRSFLPTLEVPYQNLVLNGTNMSLTPNNALNPTANGSALSTRVGTGVVTSIDYFTANPSESVALLTYSISNISVDFADILANGINVLSFVLSGNDEINGTFLPDVLRGYAGDDIFRPGYSLAFLGTEIIDGGAGNDTLDFSNTGLNLSVNVATGLASAVEDTNPLSPTFGMSVNATLISIENVTGGSGNDKLLGNSVANILDGGLGNDTLYGGLGADVLIGGDGNDVLRGDGGADRINGGAGIDRINYANSDVGVEVNLTSGTGFYGHAMGDTFTNVESVSGSLFNDNMSGSALANAIYGNSGNDKLFGLGGNDSLFGQTGDDALHGGDANDVLSGDDGIDGLFGDAGNDRLFGGNGNDYLDGGIGNDNLLDDAGNDQLYGGAGNDFFTMGVGDDFFNLGVGDDRVRFATSNGKDTIGDFGNGNDVLDFSGTSMTLASLQSQAFNTSQGVVLTFGTNSILLSGLQLSQLDWVNDFAFSV